jgi:hypothetical protein
MVIRAIVRSIAGGFFGKLSIMGQLQMHVPSLHYLLNVGQRLCLWA